MTSCSSRCASKFARASGSDSSAVRSAKRHPDDLGRRPAEQRLGALGDEQEAALGVGAVDDVRRRLHELPEARLGLAQLAFEAVALAHVADRAVRARERAVLVEPGGGDELGRDRLAVRRRAG